MCPVQAEGHFLGHYFYFRSRWSTASIEFAETEEHWEKSQTVRCYALKRYESPAAGWISAREAGWLIAAGCFMYIVPRLLFALGIIKAREPSVPNVES
jgi:hypothetical protein